MIVLIVEELKFIKLRFSSSLNKANIFPSTSKFLFVYLALSYDHRLIDGKEAVTFLVKVKEAIEDPTRLLFGI